MKNIILNTCLPVSILLVFSNTYGQKKLQPGYIINTNGDKTNGYLEFRDREKNPKTISFKETPEGRGTLYTPLQIKGFGLEDKRYESAIVSVDDKTTGSEKYTYSDELKYRTDTVFLETIFSGSKSLYYDKDKDGLEHYFIKSDSGFEWLVYKQYLKDIDGKSVVISNDKYVRQLVAYLANCPSINTKFTGVKHNQQDFVKLFSEYYKNCASTEVQFMKKKEGIKIQTGLIIGVSTTSLKFSNTGSNALNYLAKADFSSSQNFAGGLFLNLILPRNLSRWSLANELLYTAYKSTGKYNDNNNDQYYTLNETTFGYSQIRLNDMVRYKFPIGEIFLYLNGGVTNAFAISETNTRKKDSHFYGVVTTDEVKGLDDARKYEQGFIVGLGSQFNKFSVDLRYENGNGMSKISALNSKTTKFYFLLSYRF